MKTQEIETAISLFANNMRRYAEARANFRELFRVDREEAINNVDRAFEAKLEAFHTLYDVSKDRFDYFSFADTSLLIAMRNAIHHRNHPLFHSLEAELWLRGTLTERHGAALLLASHRVETDLFPHMPHYFKIDDVAARLDPDMESPYRDMQINKEKARHRYNVIFEGLKFKCIYGQAAEERYPSDQIYLDAIPVFISAVFRVFTAMQESGVRFRGYDAETYLIAFAGPPAVDMNQIEYRMVRIL